MTSYYYHRGTLVALNENNTLKYIHQDYLTGTSLMTNNTGRYYFSAWCYDP